MWFYCYCSVTKHVPWILWTAFQASLSLTVSQSLLKLMSIESVMLSNHLILGHPLLLSSVFPSITVFQWVNSSHQVAKVLELPLQHQSFQSTFRVDFLWDLLVWSPCSPGDSPEFSPATHFQSISFLALTLLNAPTLIWVRDYWKNHSLDYTMIFFFDCSEFNISEINIYLNWFPESTNLNHLSAALTILAHQWNRSQDLEEKTKLWREVILKAWMHTCPLSKTALPLFKSQSEMSS